MTKLTIAFILLIPTFTVAQNTTTVLPKDSFQINTIAATAQKFAEVGAFDSVIFYNQQLITVAKKLNNVTDGWLQSKLSKAYRSIGKSYINIGNPELALPYLVQQRPFIKDDDALADYFRNRAEVDRMYTQAGVGILDTFLIYRDSLQTLVKKENKKAGYSLVALDLGVTDYFLSLNKFDEATKYVNNANALVDKYGDEQLKENSIYMLSCVDYKKGNFDAALPNLLAIEPKAQEWDKGLYVELLRSIIYCYGAIKDYKNAYAYFEKFAPLRDSLYVKASEQNFAQMEAQYQNKDKQQQIENKNLQLSQSRTKILWLITGLGLLIAIAFLFLLNNRNKKKAAIILNEKNETLATLNTALQDANQTKAKLFSIIGHDLRSPISQVYQFLKLQQLNPEMLDEDQKNKLSTKIQTATGSLLETMEDLLLWSKTQMSEFKTNIQPTKLLPIINACENLLQLNSDAKNITYKNQINNIIEANTDAYFLQTIIRNLLQNAIKASPTNTVIEIGTINENKNTLIYIKNNGETFTQQQYQHILSSEEAAKSLNGLGLRLVDELSKKIGAVVQFMPNHTNGTYVQISLP